MSSQGGAQFQAAVVPVTPLQQNCLLIWDAKTMKGSVVDPGGDVQRLKSAIEEVGMEVESIILTHGHIDHAGGADEMREIYGAEIIGPHEDDLFLLEGLKDQGAEYGITGSRNVTPDRWLNEGDKVNFAGLEWEVFHCPGHSPGSVVFFCDSGRFAIVGDVIFEGSVGRTDLPRGDHDALISSIINKLLPLGDDIQFVPGHGGASTFGKERRTNPFLQNA